MLKELVFNIFSVARTVDCQPRGCANDWAQTPIVVWPTYMTVVIWIYICAKEWYVCIWTCVHPYAYMHILTTSACTQVRHKLLRQQSRVSRLDKHHFCYHLDPTIDWSVEPTITNCNTHSPFVAFSPQSLNELKGAVDTCLKVSDCVAGTRID